VTSVTVFVWDDTSKNTTSRKSEIAKIYRVAHKSKPLPNDKKSCAIVWKHVS